MIKPLTEIREEKFRAVIAKRQPELTVIMENIFDPHNISAMMRTCDAVGIMEIHVIYSEKTTIKKLGKKSSASARKWVKVNYYTSVKECADALHKLGFSIFATHLSADAKSLYELELSKPVALAFGNEHKGCSEELLSHADGNFIIPMSGMIQSLNVSVACAVTLYEAFRQREAAGKYAEPQLDAGNMEQVLETWSWK